MVMIDKVAPVGVQMYLYLFQGKHIRKTEQK